MDFMRGADLAPHGQPMLALSATAHGPKARVGTPPLTEENKNDKPAAESLEQYRKTWADSLEVFQRTIAANASYLKTWTDLMEQYQVETIRFVLKKIETST